MQSRKPCLHALLLLLVFGSGYEFQQWFPCQARLLALTSYLGSQRFRLA